jgi:medium-chain acyl-[acyl-carrier-protein] hydrolase
MSVAESWFGRFGEGGGATRLFLFPFAGGNAVSFLGWAALLGPEVELQVALLPGRGSRLFEPPLRELDDLVGRLATAVADISGRDGKPFVFFGHSLGALVAFEVTRALRRQGSALPDSLWVGGAEGPQTRVVQRELHDLSDTDLIGALRDYSGTPAELLDDPEMMGLLLPGIRADFALAERYVYTAAPPLDIPIHVLLGDQDPYADRGRAVGWDRESSRPVRRHVFAGDHFFIQPHQAEITARLADAARAAAGESIVDG